MLLLNEQLNIKNHFILPTLCFIKRKEKWFNNVLVNGNYQ